MTGRVDHERKRGRADQTSARPPAMLGKLSGRRIIKHKMIPANQHPVYCNNVALDSLG